VKKISSVLKIVWTRLKSPVVIGQIVAIIALVLLVANIDPQTVTSWPILWGHVLRILSNPLIVFTLLYNIFAGLNNPTDKTSF
jgi:hypothetical protein